MKSFTLLRSNSSTTFLQSVKRLNLVVLLVVGLFAGNNAYAQPTVLGSSVANGTYTTYDLVTRGGGVRFVRVNATSAGGAGRLWEFATGTAGVPNYSTNWRPYTTGQQLSAFNTYINPSTAASSARYNTSSGGQTGTLPAITNGSFYTFIVGGNSTSDNFMSVLSTTYNPKNITAASQSPIAASVGVGIPVVVTTTISAVLGTNETVYLRYSNDGFATSTITAFTTSGTSLTATIPGATNTPSAVVSYYIFSSNQSTAPSLVQADYFTLNLYNASGQNASGGGTNYTYTVGSTTPTYTWNQTGSASWATAANWTPTRTTPGVFDNMVFNNGATTTVTAIPAQTVGSITVSGNTTVNLQNAGTTDLTIGNGLAGADLSVASGSALNVNGANALALTLAAGATGSISGTMNFSTAPNTIIVTDASGLTFNSGSSLTQNTGNTGNIFGTTGTPNVVIFASGSTFEQIVGASPFGLTQPASKIIFNTGSLFKLSVANTPAFNGRIYANFEYNASGTSSPTGGNAVSIDNLTISQGTFNFNMTAVSSIRGNISVANGAALTFTPGSATVTNLNGTGIQSITTTGTGTISVASSGNLTVVSGSTVNLGTSVITGLGTFTVASGATFRTGNTGGIAASGATGSIQTTTRSFNTAANYVYNGTANQLTGTGLPATVNTLTINNTGASSNNVVTLTAITAITATAGSLTLTAGRLDLNARQLTIPSGGNVVATGGDFTATAGPLFFLGSGTTTGTMNIPTTTLAGTVTFNTGANIVTSLQINASGAVQVAPTYGAASTLIYNSGTTYNRFNEWTVATSGAGYPNNIALLNNTTLNVVNGVNQYRRAAGNLTVNTGSTFSVADLTIGNGSGIGVEFLGNIINDGTISINTGSNTTSQRLKGVNLTNGNTNSTAIVNLSGANGGDLELTGNYVDNAVLNANTRAVFFTGAGVQTISGTASAPFNIDYIVVTKASGSVQLGVNLLTGAPNGGNGITLSSATDILDLNGNIFTLGTAGLTCTIAGNGFIRSNSGTPGSMVINGTGDATGTLKFETGNSTLANLTVNRTSTGILTLGTALTVTTALTLTDGAFNLGTNTLTINGSTARTTGSVGASTGTVTFNGGSAQSVVASIFTGNAVANLNIPNANGVTFNGSAAVSSTMTVNGLFTPVAAAVISGAGTVSGTGTIQVTRAIGTTDLTNQYSLTRTLTNLTTEYIGAAAQGVTGITFGGLKISNSNGVNMAGDVTVGAGLNLNTGNLTINANILTLNGAVSRTSGNLTGSDTSNLVIAGTAGTLFFNGNYTNTNNYLKNLTINNGASATLGDSLNITGGTAPNTEGTLTVTGTGVLTTGGFLTIKSNEFGTARIAANTSGGTYISGNATVERFIPQNANRAWRLLAAPASGQTIKAAWQEGQTNVGNTTVNTNSGFGTQITGSVGVNQAGAQALGFDEYTPGASMYRYDSSTNILRAIINTKDSLIAAYQGYFLYIRGDRSQGISSSTTTLNATTLRTNGVLNLGTKTTPVVANKSALLGNPYASAIDLTTGINFTGSVGATTFRVWDPKLSTVGGYQTLTKPFSVYVITPGGGSYGISGSTVNTIESGQAFFISGGVSGGNISIEEGSKTTGSRQVFKPLGADNYPALFTNIYSVAASGNRMVDGNFVAMDNSFSNLVDDYDGRKQSNFNENFGMLRDGVRLAVEKRLPFAATDTVFYNMNQMRANNYLLELRSQNIDPSLVGILEDNYLNSRTPVAMNNNTTYNFSVDANAGSFAANRFRLVFGPMGGPLPVTFININAAASGTNIAVQWKVGSQLNLAGYEIEKSTDGRIFRKVGTQATTTGSTETLYNWMDVAAVQGNNFYRIKAIDVSGAVKYSGIVKVILGKAGAGISISPNPVKGNTVNLQFTNQQAGVYNIRVINTTGQVVKSLLTKHAGGSSFESFTISSLIVSGVYQLEIIAPNKTKQVQKLIIDTGK